MPKFRLADRDKRVRPATGDLNVQSGVSVRSPLKRKEESDEKVIWRRGDESIAREGERARREREREKEKEKEKERGDDLADDRARQMSVTRFSRLGIPLAVL